MNQKTNMRRKAVLHGECIISEGTLPENAVLDNPDYSKGYVIIADSEVTGNHHVVDVPDSARVQFFKTPENKRYIRNSVPTTVRCLISERHSEINLPCGTWELGIQQEFDYFAMQKRNVAD